MDEQPTLKSTIDPTQNTPISKDDWNKKYWFNSLQMVEVLNPLDEDWPFMVEMRHFIIKRSAKEKFPGVIANVYLDQMSKQLAQKDDNLGMMADPNLKRIYYDKLIINVVELAPQYNPVPEYLRNVSPTAQGQAPEETPPWDSSQGERARDVAPTITTPPEPDPIPETPKPVEPTEKNFSYEEHDYKMVVSKDGKEMFYRDGKLTSAAEYAKAASML